MNKYDKYAEKILPVMIEHNLVLPGETDWMADFIRENTGDEEA